MKTQFLLPNSFKKPGLILMFLALLVYVLDKFFKNPIFWDHVKIFAIYNSPDLLHTLKDDPNAGFFKIISTYIGYTLFNLVFLSGVMMAAFSRLKNEDEYIAKLRLESLVWAVYVNFIVILVADIAIYGSSFLTIVMLNMYTIPVLFLLRFNYVVFKINKLARNEK